MNVFHDNICGNSPSINNLITIYYTNAYEHSYSLVHKKGHFIFQYRDRVIKELVDDLVPSRYVTQKRNNLQKLIRKKVI